MIVATDSSPLIVVGTALLTAAVTIFGIWYAGKGDRRQAGIDRQAAIERDNRLHGAVFGYVEGGTKVAGIAEVVLGTEDKDSLGKVARDARDTANSIATKQTTIEGDVEHIRDLSEASAVMAADAKTASEANTTKLIDIETKVDAAVPLAEEAATKARAAATATEETLDLIGTHIAEDLHIHEQQRVALTAIGDQVGADVKLPPVDHALPAKKTPVKKVARKRAQR